MRTIRHMRRSIVAPVAVTAFAIALTVSSSAQGAEQQASVQSLIERGALQEAVERANAEGDNVESTYLAAQALIKMDDNGGAEERYSRLRASEDEAWKAIGESGAKALAGDIDGAFDAANRAVEANGDNPFAHYQVGLVAAKKNDFRRATEAFTRATELRRDFAYAHLYAGQAAQRLKQTAKMVEHFNAFVRLAPDAPERQAIQSILRSLP